MPKQERDLLKKRLLGARKQKLGEKKKDYTLKKERSLTGIPERREKKNKERIAQGKEPITSLTGIRERAAEFTQKTIEKRKKEKQKESNKNPVKKAKGGMVTKWESKWG
jgi:hypothetical protein